MAIEELYFEEIPRDPGHLEPTEPLPAERTVIDEVAPTMSMLAEVAGTRHGYLLSIASRYVGPQDVEDLVQDVYLNFCRRAQNPDRPLLKFESPRVAVSYLGRALGNAAVSNYRRSAGLPILYSLEELGIEPEAPPVDELADLHFGQLVDQLRCAVTTKRGLQVFVLAHAADMNYRQIGEVLGISVGTVPTYMQRTGGQVAKAVANGLLVPDDEDTAS